MISPIPFRQIRAVFDNTTITVYQAFNAAIAKEAEKAQTFVPPFKKERMTWIKPSFLWMMYRSGWAQKQGQEHILAIKITREGFEWALEHSCLSHFEGSIYQSYDEWKMIKDHSPVRIQWDPERDIQLNPLSYRAIQVGLSGTAVEKYISEWILEIKDITMLSKELFNLIVSKKLEDATKLLPAENPFPIPVPLAKKIGAS